MKNNAIKKPLILGILFFLPVFFVIIMSLSEENYNPLDIIKGNVSEISNFKTLDSVELEGHVTVLGFLGKYPNSKAIGVLNLKEVIYDKFKGFKKFQVVMLAVNGTESEVSLLKKELYKHDELKYWKFAYGTEDDISNVYKSLKPEVELDQNLSTNHVFIIDKERNQRGRIDDRNDSQIGRDTPVYGLSSYDCIEVAILKNKMAKDDMRVLFTEYRQKRKGDFSSTTRRAEDLKGTKN